MARQGKGKGTGKGKGKGKKDKAVDETELQIFRFNDRYDAILLNEVVAHNPYKDADSSDAWVDIALAVTNAVNKPGKICSVRRAQERTKLVLDNHRGEDAEKMKASGISEDYTRVTELCYDVIQLVDEGKRVLAEKRAERDKKAQQVAEKRDREAASIKSASMETVAKGGARAGPSREHESDDDDDLDDEELDQEDIEEYKPKKKKTRKTKAQLNSSVAEMLQVKLKRDAENETRKLNIEERRVALEERRMNLLEGRAGAFPPMLHDAGNGQVLANLQPVQQGPAFQGQAGFQGQQGDLQFNF